ncbi:ImmA/IrrE family metallo-endopeptidase [Rhodospirillum sp. A1_3_36]|uniref:ImmA/IrrE family metallo-endopeptidase n=1 Tax=Rhodospirillum sp. A1_3_36 TaxID=3391666 RepID=UPI0039A45274
MKQPDFNSAAHKALSLLENHSYVAPPINPEQIARDMGLRVVYADFEGEDQNNVSGFFRLADKTILVNNAISDNRITFTIAHELAHYLLHKDYIESNNYKPMPRNNIYVEEKPNEEVEADTFAANLLVPLKMLKKYKDVATPEELATLFFVSEDVIRYRLDLLKRHPHFAR